MIFMEHEVLLMNKTVKIGCATPGMILFYNSKFESFTQSKQTFAER